MQLMVSGVQQQLKGWEVPLVLPIVQVTDSGYLLLTAEPFWWHIWLWQQLRVLAPVKRLKVAPLSFPIFLPAIWARKDVQGPPPSRRRHLLLIFPSYMSSHVRVSESLEINSSQSKAPVPLDSNSTPFLRFFTISALRSPVKHHFNAVSNC